ERMYWWQLVAPGYGLVDSRETPWRKRPGYYAFQTMVRLLEESTFTEKMAHPSALIFSFQKNEESFSVCWTNSEPCDQVFEKRIIRVLNRDGKEIQVKDNRVEIDGSPKYVFFENG
ncbi:MAG: hypothetical protein JSV46_03490, partial [Candidatus Aminicenantes bacterium]